MEKQHPTSLRLSQTALDIIKRMSEKLGISRMSVVEQALRLFESWVDAGWRPPSDGENDGGNGDNRA